MRELFSKLRYLFNRRPIDNAIDEELRFHMESRIEELVAEGIDPRQAAATARKELGSPLRLGEDSRKAWAISWIEDLWRDSALAVRSMRREPGFCATAIACLALGIGANTAIFSIANELLLTDPSCRNPETLANVVFGGNSHSRPDAVRFLREEVRPFDAIEGWSMQETNWRQGDESERLFAMHVSNGYFDAIGIPLQAGRGIRAGDNDVAVLSDSFWRTRFGADPSIIGRTILLDARPHAVIGILGPRHRTFAGGGISPALYALAAEGSARPPLALVARLPAGMSRAAALAKVEAAGTAMDRIHPDPQMTYSRNNRVFGISGGQAGGSPEMQVIFGFFALLLFLVWMVFLMACINVSGLLLARASARHSETALRLALGAGRWRLIRLHLAEMLVLATGGCLAGLIINIGLMSAVSRISLPVSIPIRLDIAPDFHLFLYSFLLAFAAVVFSGLLPALRATRAGLSGAIKSQTRLFAGGKQRLRSTLVVAQITVSCLLLAVGLVFWRNLQLSLRLETGFRLNDTIMTVLHFDAKAGEPELQAVLDRIRALPGVESAGRASIVPFNDNATRGLEIGLPGSGRKARVSVHWNWVGPGYFTSIGIPVRAGREFDEQASRAEPRPVVVNENLAQKLFPDSNPVGGRIRIPGRDGDRDAVIIAVVGNSKHFTLGESGHFALYEPLNPRSERIARVIVRSAGDPAALLRPIRTAVLQLQPSAAVEVKLLRDAIGLALIPSQGGAIAAGSTGLLGLLLAATGLFGILSYTVAQRTREIGLRVALGAPAPRVAALVLLSTAKLAGWGTLLGLVISAFALQPLAAFVVPELRPNDPIHLAAVALILLTVAGLASIAPAMRALRVEPAVALRE